jgi:large subunit ribosomal protein L23
MQTRPRPVKYRNKNRKAKTPVPGPSGVELRPHQVVIRPLVTEKGTHQSERYNSYSFEVNKLATKTEIKNAIQMMFKVSVTGVSTMIRHGKNRRFKMFVGRQSDWKKAIVTLAENDKIEFF